MSPAFRLRIYILINIVLYSFAPGLHQNMVSSCGGSMPNINFPFDLKSQLSVFVNWGGGGSHAWARRLQTA
jgi:hypothetical protein